MADFAAQTVEELDFDAPDGIVSDEPAEPAIAAGPLQGMAAPSGEDISSSGGRGGARGRGGRGRGGAARGAKPREPYVPDAPATRDRLTDDELTAKMEAMRLQNAQLQAKRDAAIEDENQYSVIKEQAKKEQEEARKEQEALKARTKEIQKAIDADRDASAARKLKKLTGREWDREKTEDDWNPAYGAPPVDDSGLDDAPRAPPSSSERPARGVRGNARGRGTRGRGGNSSYYPEPPRKKQPPPAQTDINDEKQFPALNASAKAFEPATPTKEEDRAPEAAQTSESAEPASETGAPPTSAA